MRRSTTVRITAPKPAVQSTFRLRSQSTRVVAATLSQKQPSEKVKSVESHSVDVSLFSKLVAAQASFCCFAWPLWLFSSAKLDASTS